MNKLMASFLIFTCSFGSIEGFVQTCTGQQKGIPADKFLSIKNTKKIAIPLTLLTYGILGIESDGLQNIDHEFRNRIQRPHIQFKTSVDNYLQFSPALATFALKTVGVNGKNSVLHSSRIYLTSTLLMAGTVSILKHSVKSLRPDGSAYNSFPSGHTATAFAAAEFLHQEFKESNALISYTGYLAASATGALRMSNDKHYLSDVLAGAGIGILSTKAAYWINKHIFERKQPKPLSY